MDNSLKRLENESQDQYFFRICQMKEILGFTWDQMADIFNSEFGANCGESKYRKDWATFQRIFNANTDKLVGSDKYLEQLRQERRETEIERKKLQTEKLEYNKWLREEARDELICEKIIEEVRRLEPLAIPVSFDNNVLLAGKTGILCFGDEHYSTEFTIYGLHGEIINQYSPEIFEQRMYDLLNRTIKIVEKENISKLYVFALGDFQDGILRVSQLSKLRHGVIEGAVKYANFIANWLNELSKHVTVKYQMAFGNHTELRMLGQPKGTFKDDNTGLFVREIIKTRLEDNPNFEMVINPTGLIFDTIEGFNILGIHGECKNMEKALKDFSNTYDTNIHVLIGGHMHHYRSETVGINKDVINVPSIIGIDDYSVSLNKTSNPGASLFMIERDEGVTLEYKIKL